MILPEPISPVRLLEDIKLLSEATDELRDSDSVIYVSADEATGVHTNLKLTSERIEELLTQEIVATEGRMQLLVKKPDYLGNSRWEFRLDERSIEAKIFDNVWLERFRAGQIALRPGDALDALVRSELHRGFESNEVGTWYFVNEVYGVVRASKADQSEFGF